MEETVVVTDTRGGEEAWQQGQLDGYLNGSGTISATFLPRSCSLIADRPGGGKI